MLLDLAVVEREKYTAIFIWQHDEQKSFQVAKIALDEIEVEDLIHGDLCLYDLEARWQDVDFKSDFEAYENAEESFRQAYNEIYGNVIHESYY